MIRGLSGCRMKERGWRGFENGVGFLNWELGGIGVWDWILVWVLRVSGVWWKVGDGCTKSRYGGRLGRDEERRKTAYTLM